MGRGNRSGKGPPKGNTSRSGIPQERSDYTLHLYSIDEVLSALQKAVRRGHTRNAAFWAGELHVSGLTAIALKRLLIMTVEDVGIASPYAPFVAAAAQSLLLGMPEGQSVCRDGDIAVPLQLGLVCALACWVSSLPKTRTSCMLSSFQRARLEEKRQSNEEASIKFCPCTAEDIITALGTLYTKCVGKLDDFLTNPRLDDSGFLAMEEEVLLLAYRYQLCQDTEARALEPLFDSVCHAMLIEERRLKSSPSTLDCDNLRCSFSQDDFLAGFIVVRKMVSDLQHLAKGALDSAARMVLSQAFLLATRAHHLVLNGLIVVPSMTGKATETALIEFRPSDFVSSCLECSLLRITGQALANRNTRLLSSYARDHSNRAEHHLPVSLDLESFVRKELLVACISLLPKDMFKCLLLPPTKASARYLYIPPYCVDVHTRRGSGYPTHRDWEERIVPQNPGLQDWDAEEVRKSHGKLDAEGRKLAHQFSHYGLVVSDEYFPGPSLPAHSTSLRPTDYEGFLRTGLPVASLDHGELFVDKRHFPDGYGTLLGRDCSCRDLISSISESAARLVLFSSSMDPKGFCICESTSRYKSPATPLDPFFSTIKTFASWANERAFPSARDFPGAVLPKTLESIATSTINDDPSGKKVTAMEHLLEMIGGCGVGMSPADSKRSAIDSRPSVLTEFHRASMHLVMRSVKVVNHARAIANDADAGADAVTEHPVEVGLGASRDIVVDGEINTIGDVPQRRSRWGRK